MVTAYAVMSLWRLRLVIPPAHERWAGAMAGLCAGVIGGATSMFAPPLVIYLVALRLPKETFVGVALAIRQPQYLHCVILAERL